MARTKKVQVDDEAPVDAKDGERQQMTDDGPVGIPVEEMPQQQRKEVGRKLAEGATLKEAVEEAEPPKPGAKGE